MNDLHVSTISNFHQNFFWLCPAEAKVTTFRVPTFLLALKFSPKRYRKIVHSKKIPILVTFISHSSFFTQILAKKLVSLVRVSRRDEKKFPNSTILFAEFQKKSKVFEWPEKKFRTPWKFFLALAKKAQRFEIFSGLSYWNLPLEKNFRGQFFFQW